MFSAEELDCIARYANTYRETINPFTKNRMVEFITTALEAKFPNRSLSRMSRLMITLYPDINLEDIVPVGIESGGNDWYKSSAPARSIPPLARNTYDVPYVPPVGPPTRNTYVVPLARPPTRYSSRTPLPDIDSRSTRLLDLDNRSQDLESSIQEYTKFLDKREKELVTPKVPDSSSTLDRLRSRLYQEDPVVQNTDWMDSAERACYKKLSKEDKNIVLDSYTRMREAEPTHNYPLRMRILLSDIPEGKKLEIFNRLGQQIPGIGEGPKYTAWITSMLNIPFGIHTALPCDANEPSMVQNFLGSARKIFDEEIYGHDKVKDEFVSILGSWIKLGASCGHGNVIGVTGPVGVGKTSLAKSLARVLGRPFYFISLGGSCYSSMLNGHSYTYEGATHGEIARALMESQCMDPVFFFDELDKVSGNDRGEEIINMLIHLTDPTQNTNFIDRYFAGVPLDVSKALFVFSYNAKEKVNPILRDRIHEICLKDFDKVEKIVIAKEYVIPTICSEMNLEEADIFQFEPGALECLVELCDASTGLRLLKTILIRLLRIVIVAHMTEGGTILSIEKDSFKDGSFTITSDIVEHIFKNHREGHEIDDSPPSHMYM